MPKLIDYPRTSYTGAWELAEIVDDTGGKCAIETAARKLNRKVSGSFKAIIGSAVKFGLVTSKRELLNTTTLFKRIKHAYDKKEELLFHKEAFLTPPLFTQICRKFRGRELPVQMLDVMLIREFGVEEINAQGVAKAFVDGCRMVGLLDERNIVADIDALAAQQGPRRELSSIPLSTSSYRPNDVVIQGNPLTIADSQTDSKSAATEAFITQPSPKAAKNDAVANLFGLLEFEPPQEQSLSNANDLGEKPEVATNSTLSPAESIQNPFNHQNQLANNSEASSRQYQIQIQGPGVNTTLSITEEEDISLAIALLEKIRRQIRNQ